MDQRGFQVQVAQDQVLNVFYSFFGYTLSYHPRFTQDDLELQIMYNVCILQQAALFGSMAYRTGAKFMLRIFITGPPLHDEKKKASR